MTVKLHQVSKRFGALEAVRKLDLILPDHGTIAIMGPSGCGKTTVLQMLAGLIRPDSGTLLRPACRMAYVFQEPRLLPWRTVLDNILLARASSDPPMRTALEWLDAVGLGDCAERYPDELSGGMKQRVSIARALYCDSEMLLLDEPFHGLDEQNREHVMALIQEERRGEDKLTVLVTHDREEAREMADTLVIFDGAPASTYHTESLK